MGRSDQVLESGQSSDPKELGNFLSLLCWRETMRISMMSQCYQGPHCDWKHYQVYCPDLRLWPLQLGCLRVEFMPRLLCGLYCRLLSVLLLWCKGYILSWEMAWAAVKITLLLVLLMSHIPEPEHNDPGQSHPDILRVLTNVQKFQNCHVWQLLKYPWWL